MPVTAVRQMDNQSAATTGLTLISQAFRHDHPIPYQYTCKGQGVSPPLAIMNVPDGTRSLALIMHDPDAVSGDFTHWLVWDMPARTESISANSVPVGAIQGSNSLGEAKYMGPCPPAGTGTHHYQFELYALDQTLGLESGTNRQQLEEAMVGNILAKAKLTGLFTA